jgi:Flp pilus assembly protein TadD
MAARKLFLIGMMRAVLLLTACGVGAAQTSTAPPAAPESSSSPSGAQSQPDSQQQPSQPSDGYSSSQRHRKDRVNEHETIRHTRVAEETSSPELTQAEDLIQKQNYAAAEPLLHKATESDPSNYAAWFDLGFVENNLGKTDDSIAAYRKSVAAKPDIFESNLNLGIQLAKTGQPDAEKFLRAATVLTPTSNAAEGQERAWLSLGELLEKSRPDDAVVAYQRAAILQPKDPEPHLDAGLILEKQKKFADAEQEYKQALALDPKSDAVTGLANVYMLSRRFPQAEEYLRKVVAAHPDEAAAHVQLGRVLAAEEKNDAAILELQTGAKLAPAGPVVQRELADLYAAAGKNDQAEAAYRALIAAHPDDAELHRDLGQSLLRQKKFPEAQKEFVAAVNLRPTLGEAYGDLAFAASENKDYPVTIKALDARAKFLPEIPITYFLRASAWDHLRDFKQAAANYHLFLNSAAGKYPDQEWQAKHRLIAIEPQKK